MSDSESDSGTLEYDDFGEDLLVEQEPEVEPDDLVDVSSDSDVDNDGSTWRKLKRKAVKDKLLRDYTLRMASKWHLSRAQIAELNETLAVYVAFRIIAVADIVLESTSKIHSIKCVQFMPGAFCFVFDEHTPCNVATLLALLHVPPTLETYTQRPVSLSTQVRKRIKKFI